MQFSTFYDVGKYELRDMSSFYFEDREYLITSDRKGNIYIFHRNENHKLTLFRKFKGHNLGVSSLCYIKSWKGEDIIITGALDKKANFWKINNILNLEHDINPFYTLELGGNICLIKEIAKGEICFISWDNTTTIVFEDERKNIVLDNGSLPSWDIIKIDNLYISADASKSISIFDTNDGKLIDKIKNVDSCALRGIFQYKNNIYTTSNQGMIFEFSYNDGKLKKEREYQITNEPLYKYSILTNKLYIGGENKVIFVVDLDLLKIVDVIPVIGNIWGCNFTCTTKDLCVSTDKGFVHVFTTDSLRFANENETQDFLDRLGSTPIPDQIIENVDPDELPEKVEDEDFQPGRFYAIKELDKIKILVYSNVFHTYVCIGNASINDNKKILGPDGKQYDTSITIIGEDEIAHELYLNYNDDPDNLAKHFCEENHLEDRFIQQISDFIKNSFNSDQFKKFKKIKNESSGTFEGSIFYGIAEMQGRRPYMEDFNTVFQLSNGKIIFCVFDGHGSDKAAIYAKENIQAFLEKNIQSDTFIADSLKQMNSEMVKQFDDCGSTAVVACFSPQDHTLVVSNLGDSRAIICKEKPIQITVDHKASDPSEIEFIEKNGGSIVDGRISGIINLSRFLGDGIFSNCINKEPYSSLTKVEKGDRILIGCDGIFDFLTNEQCSQIVRSSETAKDAAVSVRDQSYNIGSADNLTTIVFEIIA